MPVSATDNIVNDAIAYLKPVVQDSDAPTLKVAAADEPVIRAYNDELCICYLVDHGTSFRYVQNRSTR